MGSNLSFKAFQEFKKGNYEKALSMYEELRDKLDTHAFDYNINICLKNLNFSQRGQDFLEANEYSGKEIVSIKNKGLDAFFEDALSLMSPAKQNVLIYIASSQDFLADKKTQQKFEQAKIKNCKIIIVLDSGSTDLKSLAVDNSFFDEIYLRPFKGSDQFWINYSVNCSEFDSALILNPKELRGASRLKAANIKWENDSAQFAFANGIPCAYLISYSLLKEFVGFHFPFEAKYSFYEYFCRMNSRGLIGERNLKKLTNCIKFEDHEKLSLEVLRKWIKNKSFNSRIKELGKAIDDPEIYKMLPNKILGGGREIVDFYSSDAKLESRVKLFCFSEYLERAGITGKVKNDDIITLDGLEDFSVTSLSNDQGGKNFQSIIDGKIFLTYIDLLPLRSYQITDIEQFKSNGAIPLATMVPVVKRLRKLDYEIGQWSFPDNSKVFGMISACFNNSKTVISSLMSVLGQSVKNLEMVIVDDNSNDNSLELVNGFLSLFPYVKARVVAKEYNSGVYSCRNTAIIKSTSEYLFGQDLDDYSSPQRAYVSNVFYKSKEVDFLVCNHARIDSGFNVLSMKKGSEVLKTYRKGLMTWHTERKNFFKYGMFLSIKKSGDSEFYDRLKRLSTNKVYDLGENFYYALMDDANESRLTSDIFKVGKEKSPLIYRFEGSESRFEFEKRYKELHNLQGLSFNFRFGRSLDNENKKIIANMATIPGREYQLAQSVRSILQQVDELNLFLNGEIDLSVSDLRVVLNYEKINIYKSSEIGDLRDNSKFYLSGKYSERCYYLTLDDDLVYPIDYVDRLLYKSKIYNDRNVLTVHGYQLWESVDSIHTDKKKRGRYYHFKEGLDFDVKVDIAGTGTVLIPPGVKMSSFNNPPFGMVDVIFAHHCSNENIDIISIDRSPEWVSEAEREFGKNTRNESRLYLENQRDDREELIKEYLKDIEASGLKNKEECNGNEGKTFSGNELKSAEQVSLFDKSDHLLLRGFDRKVYICCTGYNYAGYAIKFARSLWHSLRVCSYDDIKVLIYDDCSSDGSSVKLRSYFEQNFTSWNWEIFEGEENKGPAFARSFLFDQVVEDDAICIFLDSDDEVEPALLRRILLEYFYYPDTLGTFGGWRFNDTVKKTWPSYTQAELTSVDDIIGRFKFGHPRSFLKSVYDQADKKFLFGPDGQWLKYCSDLGLYLAILSNAELSKFRRIDDLLYRYNAGTANGTINRFGSNKEVMRDYLFSLYG